MQACGKRKPRNRRRFILSYSNILEDLGYSHEQVREMLNIVTNMKTTEHSMIQTSTILSAHFLRAA